MADTDEVEISSGLPLELILARNLISIISLAAFLVDTEERVVFFNEAAAAVVGQSFEERGTLTREEWNTEYGPFDATGSPIQPENLPLTVALRQGHPAYGRFRIRADRGLVEIETGAFPLIGPAGYHGAMIVFWVVDEGASG